MTMIQCLFSLRPARGSSYEQICWQTFLDSHYVDSLHPKTSSRGLRVSPRAYRKGKGIFGPLSRMIGHSAINTMYLLASLYNRAHRAACISEMRFTYIKVTTKRVRCAPQYRKSYRPMILRRIIQNLLNRV